MGNWLTREQPLQVAQLSGAAVRLGRSRDIPDPLAVAELREISNDPVVLGIAAASALVEVEANPRNGHATRALPLLRRAGADEAALVAEATEVRERRTYLPHSI